MFDYSSMYPKEIILPVRLIANDDETWDIKFD